MVERPESDTFVSRHGTCGICRNPIVEHTHKVDRTKTWHHYGTSAKADHEPVPLDS